MTHKNRQILGTKLFLTSESVESLIAAEYLITETFITESLIAETLIAEFVITEFF